jgi:hypothetical protein
VEWKEPSGSAESVCVSILVSIKKNAPPPKGDPIKLRGESLKKKLPTPEERRGLEEEQSST